MNQNIQPDVMKTDKFVSFCGGKGNDEWNMLVACITGNSNIVRDLLNKEPYWQIAIERIFLRCTLQLGKDIRIL